MKVDKVDVEIQSFPQEPQRSKKHYSESVMKFFTELEVTKEHFQNHYTYWLLYVTPGNIWSLELNEFNPNVNN